MDEAIVADGMAVLFRGRAEVRVIVTLGIQGETREAFWRADW